MSIPHYMREFDLLVLGELLVEMSCSDTLLNSDSFIKSIGGDCTYTAITSALLGSKVRYVSAMGRDPFHSMIRNTLHEYKINTDLLVSTAGYNGIYFIDNAEGFDVREYLYHRSGDAVKSTDPSILDDNLIGNSKIVYSSSEFQSLSKSCRQTVFKAFYSAHTHDSMVAYDPNLRLQRWSLDEAREAVWSILPFVDVMLPSAPEESKALFGYERAIDIIGFLWDRGVNVVAVKTGKMGCTIGYDGKIEEFSIPEPSLPVKYLTHIGSVFNGALLSSIAFGQDPFTAAQEAVKTATNKGMQGNGIRSIVVD